MNKLKFLIIITLVILVFGCGESNPNPESSAEGKRGFKPGNFEVKNQPGVPIEVTFLEKGDITNQLLFSSSLETENMFSYSAVPEKYLMPFSSWSVQETS